MKRTLIFLALLIGMIDSLDLYADSDDDLSKYILQWVKEGKVLSFDVIKKRYVND